VTPWGKHTKTFPSAMTKTNEIASWVMSATKHGGRQRAITGREKEESLMGYDFSKDYSSVR
jgi:hypothetical protein